MFLQKLLENQKNGRNQALCVNDAPLLTLNKKLYCQSNEQRARVSLS